MTGYQYIKRMSIKEIEKTFGLGRASAIEISQKNMKGLILSCHTCPQLLKLDVKWPCNFQETSCRKCMKQFLENEIPGTDPVIEGPCVQCMELEFCQGLYRCQKLEEYQNEKK